MENKENNSIDLYNRGKKIVEDIEKYSGIMTNSDGEDKDKAKQKVVSLNDEKDKLKEEIYKEAKEKSGLDYSKKDKNPELLRKEYNNELADLKKRKHELKVEKIRIEKLNEQKKVQIKEQFEIASEKYKMMLDMGKITQELYEARIENMKSAKLRDELEQSNKLYNIKEESDRIESEIENVKGKLIDIEQKEIIYNEYGDVYYRLFGEVLADRNKLDTQIENKQNENIKTNGDEKVENSGAQNNIVKENNTNNASVQPNNTISNDNSNVQEKEQQETENESEKETRVSITSKSMFNELYKKMKKGTITDNELSALAETLENSDNYDKYGITTGLVFNKAKKILKYQGARTAKNIEKFLRENSIFSEDIKFDAAIEKDNVVSHDILNSWKDIDEKLTYTDSVFSVEKYIDKIEKYKEDGNELTKEQENMLNKALDIKNNLASYRKAINTNEEVSMERNDKMHNSIFYKIYSDKFKSESKRTLPEARTNDSNPGFIVVDRSNFDLSSMVNIEPTSKDLENNERTEDNNINRDKVK